MYVCIHMFVWTRLCTRVNAYRSSCGIRKTAHALLECAISAILQCVCMLASIRVCVLCFRKCVYVVLQKKKSHHVCSLCVCSWRAPTHALAYTHTSQNHRRCIASQQTEKWRERQHTKLTMVCLLHVLPSRKLPCKCRRGWLLGLIQPPWYACSRGVIGRTKHDDSKSLLVSACAWFTLLSL